MSFSGFPTGTLGFLEELSRNNNRDWFTENKTRYQALVQDPALDFIEAMAPSLAQLSRYYEAIPRRTGGSLMRVYRDTRFSPDKTPYKTNIGIQFRHAMAKDVHAPGLYLHIEPGDIFVGVGSWRPDSKALAKIRTRIAEKPELWRQVIDNEGFNKHFSLAGDRLQRPPRGYDRDHPMLETLKWKDFIGIKALTEKTIISSRLQRTAASRFSDGFPLIRFLCEALELPV